MALPVDYSPWEHLQSSIMRVQNRIIREEFSDLGDDWEPDISNPRGSLRQTCTLEDGDSAIMIALRLWFFYGTLRKAQDFQAPLYGIPVINFQENYRFQPQITLYFQQDLDGTPEDKQPLRSQISFRYSGETNLSITEANARTIANRIKAELATGTPYRWNRGRISCRYLDKDKGYMMQLYTFSAAEGREVVRKVLSIRNHSFDDDFYSFTTSDASFPVNPGTQFLYGKSRPKPRKRPIGYVRFKHATLSIHGLPRPICLVDTTGRFRDALEQVK